MKRIIVSSILFSLLVSPAHSAIRVITESENTEKVVEISNEAYVNHIVNSVNGVSNSVNESLVHSEVETKKWFVKLISVGIGFKGDIGLGPFKLGTSLRQRFNYER